MADLLATRSSGGEAADWGFAAFVIVTFAIAVALSCIGIYMQ